MEQGSKDWFEFRKNKIGSSDASAIMEVSPYKTSYELWLEKTEQAEPREVNKFITDKGHFYEDLARLDLEKKTGQVWKPETFISDENESWHASVDGFCEATQEIWECKYMGRDRFNDIQNDYLTTRQRLNEDYYCQVMHQCLVTGADRFSFTACIDNKIFSSLTKPKFHHYFFVLTEDDFNFIKEFYKPKLLEFTHNMLTKTKPFIVTNKKDEPIPLNDGAIEVLLNTYHKLNEEFKVMKKDLEIMKALIFEKTLPVANKVTVGKFKVSKSIAEPKSYIDYELLIKENAQAFKAINITKYKRYKKPSETKSISIPKTKS